MSHYKPIRIIPWKEGPVRRKVLCVCLGNTCRSPMMAALLQKELGDEFRVESAGIKKEAAGQSANEHSILCMKERGIDITGHRSRWIGELDLTDFEWVVGVGQVEVDAIWEFVPHHTIIEVVVANKTGGGVPDPFQKGLPAYRECLALLDRALPAIADQI